MTVGSYQAKTHLPALLDRVAKGETITITRHGVPVAQLVPAANGAAKKDVAEVIRELKEFRKGNRLRGLSITKLIREGRH